MTLPFISVLIPTYGREKVLCDTITDVLNQTYDHYEVIEVDQTTHHEAETIAYLDAKANAEQIQWYQVPWASLPGARNYGVRRAKGEIVLFIDDDVQITPDFLTAHAKNFANPEVGAVAGRVFDRMKLSDLDPNLQIEYLPPQAMDPGIAWYHLNLVHTIKPQQVITARGCNMSFRRVLFDTHNIWFDERFQGSAVREESDFCLRIRRTGFKIWYDPNAHLIHLGEETGGCHDISSRSLRYQFTYYHNHFLMAFKNLTANEFVRLAARLFDCHVLGRPPCHKSSSPIKIVTRGLFYSLGFLNAVKTLAYSVWSDGQNYTKLDVGNA